MLMQMFDSDLLDSVFNERFNNYLSSLINFEMDMSFQL